MCDWGYCTHNGPSTWNASFPLANGPRQSPIDIVTGGCRSDGELKGKPLQFKLPTKASTILNTGAGWKVNVIPEGSVLQGGPLSDKYQLVQYHVHWGRDCSTGSEHTVDGNCYPAEIHLVHWNCDKYKSFEEAADKEDGLCVLGIFFKVGAENKELQKLVELLPKIPYKGDSTPVGQDVDPVAFIPGNRSYWTYPGSLTTPPCLESVTWIVFKEPVEVSEKQIEAFRQLFSFGKADPQPNDEFSGRILTNFRPPLNVGQRVVKSCD